jgi:hypothetical protein
LFFFFLTLWSVWLEGKKMKGKKITQSMNEFGLISWTKLILEQSENVIIIVSSFSFSATKQSSQNNVLAPSLCGTKTQRSLLFGVGISAKEPHHTENIQRSNSKGSHVKMKSHKQMKVSKPLTQRKQCVDPDNV